MFGQTETDGWKAGGIKSKNWEQSKEKCYFAIYAQKGYDIDLLSVLYCENQSQIYTGFYMNSPQISYYFFGKLYLDEGYLNKN